LILAMVALFFALAAMGTSGAVKQHERPRPTPELMAPSEPKVEERTGMTYAIGASFVDGGGW